MRTITYQDVFGVPLGQQVDESHPLGYWRCPAAEAMRSQLSGTPFFASRQEKLQGIGPLYRDNYKHEFNRHHAGLAVDIMLTPKTDEVTLGQNLVVLLNQFADTIKFRGMIYQNVTVDLDRATWRAQRWSKGGHDNHIHIDWHDTNRARWTPITDSIPLRLGSGRIVQMMPVDAGRIANSIEWAPESGTLFGQDVDLQNALVALVDRWSRGLLQPVDLDATLAVAGSSTASGISALLTGTWDVTIGQWQGLFAFSADGSMYWASSVGGARTSGHWMITTRDVRWTFYDPGDFRVFTVPLQMQGRTVQGTVLPAGQGAFKMTKQ